MKKNEDRTHILGYIIDYGYQTVGVCSDICWCKNELELILIMTPKDVARAKDMDVTDAEYNVFINRWQKIINKQKL